MWEILLAALDSWHASLRKAGGDGAARRVPLQPTTGDEEFSRAKKRYQRVRHDETDRVRRGPDMPVQTRREVLAAWEESDRRCALCGDAVDPDERVAVDHIVPVSRGGSHDLANLRVTHARCNIRRGNTVWEHGTDLRRISVHQDSERAGGLEMDKASCRACRVVNRGDWARRTEYYIELEGFGREGKVWLCPEHQNWRSLRSYLLFRNVPVAELDRPGQGETWVWTHADAAIVAWHMLNRLTQERVLYQEVAAADIVSRFGERFTCVNEDGGIAIDRAVLREFRAWSGSSVVWNRRKRFWRSTGGSYLPSAPTS